jgi:hypothetical protein
MEDEQKQLYEEFGEAVYTPEELANDPLLAKDFDLVTFFNKQYPTSDCLDNIIDEIKMYD